jgi:predicted dehydrogenase
MLDSLTWGILGTARINRKIVPAMRKARCANLVGVASRSLEKAEEFASEYGVPRAYGDYADLVADPKIDCLYIPLPNALHAVWTIKALEAGKHVLCEKPLTANVAEAIAIKDAEIRCGTRVMEAFMYRFHPQWSRVLMMVETGEIGTLRTIRGEFAVTMNDPANVRLSADLAGGSLMDLGCYCINAARMLTASEPVGVTALAQFGERSRVEEDLVATLEFPGPVTAQISSSFRSCYRHTVDIVGTEASIHLSHPWNPPPDAHTQILFNRNDACETLDVGPADQYTLEIDHFCEAILASEPFKWGIEDSISQMQVIDAVYASARANQLPVRNQNPCNAHRKD